MAIVPHVPWVDAIPVDLETEYLMATAEWFAQQRARFQLRYGPLYRSRVDLHKRMQEEDRRASAQIEQHLMKKLGPPPGDASSGKPTRYQTSRERGMMKYDVGVLTDTHLYLRERRIGKGVKIALSKAIQHIGGIFQLALDHHLKVIWVLGPAQLSKLATQEFVDEARDIWDVRYPSWREPKGTREKFCSCVGAFKREAARTETDRGTEVFVSFAAYNLDWQYEGVENPVTLLDAIIYLEDALGVPIIYSPGSVGKALMIKTTGKGDRPEWRAPLMLEREHQVRNVSASACLWRVLRPLSIEEEQLGYVIAVDKNSTWPAACTGVLLGVGDPVPSADPMADFRASIQQADKPRPGLWLCRISGTSQFDGVSLPHPTDGKTEGWFWSHTTKLLDEVGYTVEVDAAWIWAESHTILRTWAEKGWDARVVLKTDADWYRNEEARELAYDAMKGVLTDAIGWLGMPRSEPGDWGERPDWRALIVDYANRQVFWRIRTAMKVGYVPIGVHSDCLFYITDSFTAVGALSLMDGQEGRPKPMLERADHLGGWKHKYGDRGTIPMEVVAPLFRDVNKTIGAINNALNTYDRARKEGR